jgi:hypothetical protein
MSANAYDWQQNRFRLQVAAMFGAAMVVCQLTAYFKDKNRNPAPLVAGLIFLLFLPVVMIWGDECGPLEPPSLEGERA